MQIAVEAVQLSETSSTHAGVLLGPAAARAKLLKSLGYMAVMVSGAYRSWWWGVVWYIQAVMVSRSAISGHGRGGGCIGAGMVSGVVHRGGCGGWRF